MFHISISVFVAIVGAVWFLDWCEARKERRRAAIRDRLLSTVPQPYVPPKVRPVSAEWPYILRDTVLCVVVVGTMFALQLAR